MFAIRRATASLCVTFLLFQGGVSVSTARECYADSPGEVAIPEDVPCVGLPTESCATFAAGVYDELDTWLGVLPVSSDPPPRSINFNEIILDDCTDTKITFEVKIHGWDPDMSGTPGLKDWEVDLDSSSYAFDMGGSMTPEAVACTSVAECLAAWGGVCTMLGDACTQDIDCYFYPFYEECGGAPCDYPTGVGGFCSPGFQYTGRTDGVRLRELPYVDVSTLDFIYGSTVSPAWDPLQDTGIIYYGGTLKLITSSDVAGMAAVFSAPTSFMRDGNNNLIPLTGLVHAYVICQTGECCDLTIADDPLTPENEPCLADDVPEQECRNLVADPTKYYWNPARTCADSCGECMGSDHAACGDGDACTVNRCVDELCEGTPVVVNTHVCCDPMCAPGSPDDYDGLGEISWNVDGDPCTDDLCNPGTGCAVAPQCGVPDNPSLPPGATCLVGGDPCLTGQCSGDGLCVFRKNVCGACCLPNGSCTGGVTGGACASTGGEFNGIRTLCLGDSDGDGKDDLCVRPPGMIPTVSQWGVAAMLLLLLSAARICFRRHVRQVPPPFQRGG